VVSTGDGVSRPAWEGLFLGRRSVSVNLAVLWEGILKFVKGRKSVILGVWAAPWAPETLPKGGGLRPPPFAWVCGVPGAAQTRKMTDFRFVKNFKIV
jgi:hypothetical protein